MKFQYCGMTIQSWKNQYIVGAFTDEMMMCDNLRDSINYINDCRGVQRWSPSIR